MKQYKKLKLVSKRPSPMQANPNPENEADLFQANFSNQYLRQSNIFEKESPVVKSAKQKKGSSVLPLHVYHDFVDRYVVQNIRAPQTPLPINIIETEMQMAFQTRFQEYVYQMAKVSHRELQKTKRQ